MRQSIFFRYFCLFLSAALVAGCGAKTNDGCGVNAEGNPLTARLSINSIDSIVATHSTLLTTDLVQGDLVEPLTIEWTQLSGEKGTLDPNIYTPAFSAIFSSGLAVGQVKIKAKITDAKGLCISAEKSITVTALEITPLSFGENHRKGGAVLTVPVMEYGVPPEDISTQWTQTAGPTVSLAPYDGQYYKGIVFTIPDSLSPLGFRVKVFKKGIYFGTGSISFEPINRSPLARAYFTPNLPRQNQLVNLLGVNSTDPDGDQLSYSWSQLSGPAVAIVGANTVNASFIAPSRVLPLQFRLKVTDQFGAFDIYDLHVNLINRRPLAHAGVNFVVPTGQRVQLDGSASSDADNNALTYTWTQESGLAVQLSNSSSARPDFIAPESGQALTFRLQVHDGNDASENTSTVIVAIKPDTLNQDTDRDGVHDSFDLDADGDGLIEIFTLEQLFSTQSRMFDGSGCSSPRCVGFELTSDLDFDSNQDGVVDDSDYRYSKYPSWEYYQGSNPFSFDGNGYSIRNFKGNYHALFGGFRSTDPVTVSDEFVDYFIRNLNLQGTVNHINSTGGLLDAVELDHRKRLTIANVNLEIEFLRGGEAGGFIETANIRDGSVLTIRNSTANIRSEFDSANAISSGGFIGSIYMERSLVEVISSTANMEALVDSNSGGLIGDAVISDGDLVIDGCIATGTLIDIGTDAAWGAIGGLVGYIYSNYGDGTRARYFIRDSASAINVESKSRFIGGFIGGINAPSPLTSLVVERSLYSGEISGIRYVGGLLGLARVGSVDITDSLIAGHAKGSGRFYELVPSAIGGIAGGMRLAGPRLNLTNVYSLMKVSGDAETGGLFGVVDNQDAVPGATMRIENSYWARDSADQDTTIGSEPIVFIQDNSVVLEHSIDMACPTYAGDNGCGAGPSLYIDWNLSVDNQGNPVWLFGNGDQFPGLQVGGQIYRPNFDVTKALYFATGE